MVLRWLIKGNRQSLDEAVLRFRQERSEAAFRALYRTHSTRLHGMCRKLAHGGSIAAEDIVQETWLRAIAAIDRFEGRSAFGTWLCGIAVNVFHERLRVSMASAEVRQLDPETALDPFELEPALFERIAVQQALAMLSPGYRTAIILHDAEGFTHDEIAEMLGISPGTSKSQLARARARLRGLLADPADQSGKGSEHD